MGGKEPSLREALDDAELDRIAFVVYKKAMTLLGYTGTVLALSLAVFAFFGFDKWKDISAQLDEIEKQANVAKSLAGEAKDKTSAAENQLSALEKNVAENGKIFNDALHDTLMEAGRMRQVGAEAAELRTRISEQQKAALGTIEEARRINRQDLETNLAVLQSELKESASRGAEVKAFQDNITKTSKDVADKVDRSLDAGFTVLILQDKHSTNILAKGSNLGITLGDAGNDGVRNVVIQFGPGQSTPKDAGKFLRPNDEISFNRIDADGKPRKYIFKVLDINMLAFRDLVTCELRWELAPDTPEKKVAQVGG